MAVAPSTSGLLTISEKPNIRIYYEITCKLPVPESKSVIILSNSLAAATPLWDIFTSAFANDYVILRFDARFHGQSPLSDASFDYEAGHTIEDLAEDVIKLMDKLEIPKAEAFIGLSIGAGVGVALAAQHPQRFQHFFIVGTKAQKSPGDDAAYNARIALGKEQGTRAQGRQSIQRWFGKEWIATNPLQADALERVVGSQNLEGFIASVAALRKLDLWPHAAAIREHGDQDKVLFVVGENDALPVVEDTKKLAGVTRSDVVVLEGTGHIVNVQAPEQFHALVRQRLAGR
jgi:pimeloyl-ACP methyl ester carboxylesterase